MGRRLSDPGPVPASLARGQAGPAQSPRAAGHAQPAGIPHSESHSRAGLCDRRGDRGPSPRSGSAGRTRESPGWMTRLSGRAGRRCQVGRSPQGSAGFRNAGTRSGVGSAAQKHTGQCETSAREKRGCRHSPGLGSPSPGFPRDPRSFFLPFPLPLPSLRSDISPKMSALLGTGWATVTRDKFGPRAWRKVCPRREKRAAGLRGGRRLSPSGSGVDSVTWSVRSVWDDSGLL